MKTKIYTLFGILVLICFMSTYVKAQGLYLKLNAGYNFASGTGYNFLSNRTTTQIDATNNKYKEEKVDFSLGKGINITLTPGYMLNKNFGAELGISYLIGFNNEFTNIHNYTNGKQDKDVFGIKGSLISFTPSIVIASGFDKIDPYSRLGIIIGIPTFTEESTSSQQNGDVSKEKNEYSGGIAIGVTGALGVMYPISESFCAFIEVALNSLTYSPTKSILTESTSNGIDQLPSMTTSNKETEYVDPYEYDYVTTPDPGKPSKSGSISLPFNSLGFNIGICMKFGK